MSLQQSPYLREQRQFPNEDLRDLSNQVDHAYIDIASKVNSRTIGLFAVNFPIVTGETWYLAGQANKQQTLRQIYPFFGITAATQTNPAVLTIPGNSFSVGQSIYITNVAGMTELNGNTYTIIEISGSSVTINVDSTGFSAYTSGGIAISPHGINFATVSTFTRIYGVFTDGTNYYPLPYVDVSAANNQVNIVVGPTNIVITAGAGSPPTITSGIVVLEWLSQV